MTTKYFARRQALNVISSAIQDAQTIRIATAFFEPSGYKLLEPVLHGKEVRLLLGREEGKDDKVDELIKEFISALDEPMENKQQTIEELRDAIQQGKFLVGVNPVGGKHTRLEPRYYNLHAKVYIGDKKYAVVSSSNFTSPGLQRSIEAGHLVTEPEDVLYYVKQFDLFFAKAIPISEFLLKAIDDWLRLFSPYEIYIHSLLHLYDLSDLHLEASLPPLTEYQEPVVARAKRSFEQYDGAMIIASTGLGKTIMAGYLAAILHKNRMINRAIVLCPSGLKKMWKTTMRMARLSSIEFSYYLMSNEDQRRIPELITLENELEEADENTLIILDESHHMRNEKQGLEMKLRNKRVDEFINKKAKILLMTATPYSKDITDVNAQLKLLPRKNYKNNIFSGIVEDHPRSWHVQKPEDLSQLAVGVVLTTPTVVKFFSSLDRESNSRYILYNKNEKRYFPDKINMRNIDYDNHGDEILEYLFEKRLLQIYHERDDNRELFGDISSSNRDPLFEARLVNQFCSSLAEANSVLQKMENEDSMSGFEKLKFANQDELRKEIKPLRSHLQPFLRDDPSVNDDKIRKLLNIIKKHYQKKIIIFCEYQNTADYLVTSLRRLFPEKITESNSGKKAEDLEKVIRKFAPKANGVNPDEEFINEKETHVDILVATRAISEGFNFQDAGVLVNFDLPWTVLSLAQRLGRILRPWEEPREIYVYSFIASTMTNKKILHAGNWHNRLHKMNAEAATLSQIPFMVSKEESVDMTKLALAQNLSNLEDEELSLDEINKFIENVDHLYSNSFIDDLAKIDEKDRERIFKFQMGIKSIKKLPNNKKKNNMLYVLLKYKQKYFPAIFNEDGNIHKDIGQMDEIMKMIQSGQEELPAQLNDVSQDFSFDNLDQWLYQCKTKWIKKKLGDDPEEKVIVANYMILV